MTPQPLTVDNYVTRRIEELIMRDGEVSDFEFRRLVAEVLRIPDPVRQACLHTTLLGLFGEYAEARKVIDGYSNAAACSKDRIDIAAALHAAQRFSASAEVLRGLPREELKGSHRAGLALKIALGVFAFGLAREFMELVDMKDDFFHGLAGSEITVRKSQELGLKDEHVQAYVQRCVDAVFPWAEGKRRALRATQMVIEDTQQIVIEIEVPAEPEEFGEIMWAIACIDKSEYSEVVERHVLVDAIPLQEMTH